MSYIGKPKVAHPGLPRNELNLTVRDYEGGMSTLCAGCGHDSITGALTQAIFELSIPPHRLAKVSGIGCSSKTPAYFASASHGFNTVHGRMPSVVSGANAANKDLYYIGVSGDGDTLSIGLGQFMHAVRRNLNMLYIIENNGVYGLTKGQFSASADVGSTAKKGDANQQPPIDPALTLLSMGATFIARSFSGDREQLVTLIKAGLKHRGLAMIDVISPCVTFNNHEGSTKSYEFTRQHAHVANYPDFVPVAKEIRAEYAAGEAMPVRMHDGSQIVLRKADGAYDPTDSVAAFQYIHKHRAAGEIVTGLIYIDETKPDMHELANTPPGPLASMPFEKLCPGKKTLASIQARYR
ncbi:MAG: 2-oxoacid:ferredoxin oxidoreductase subunit beta [Gammaproteobacteria bacterium]|jgi:2-oxoglutarate ferredoxin oxidoreductase subunit beta|nr:2-oxoacid:ferredoxin oxidoreductase subunit beta [Gammaproteobacteria bacterium]